MKTSEKQITLIINKEELPSKEALAMAETEGLPIRTIDVRKEALTETRFFEIAELLGVKIVELVNKEHSNYLEKGFEDTDSFDEWDWAKILKHDPEIMRLPIAYRGHKAMFVETPAQLLDL